MASHIENLANAVITEWIAWHETPDMALSDGLITALHDLGTAVRPNYSAALNIAVAKEAKEED